VRVCQFRHFGSANSIREKGLSVNQPPKSGSIIHSWVRYHLNGLQSGLDNKSFMDESALIQQAQRGDLQAFNTLVLHYQSQVYNLTYRVMGEGDSAADMTQEAFISAYKNIRRFRGGSFKAWLMRIATNACYDELRRRKRRPQTSLEALYVVDEDPSPTLHSETESPEKSAMRGELAAAIQRCISALPESQRIAAVLCDVQGYSYEEISSMMGISLGTVKSRLSRARTKLRDCLRGVGELLPARYRLDSE
jgi:RNA polymerase sigma-70 factor (ECF subfamily)